MGFPTAQELGSLQSRTPSPTARGSRRRRRRRPGGQSAGRPGDIPWGTRARSARGAHAPGCSRSDSDPAVAAAPPPGKRRPALPAGHSLLPAPKGIMEEQASGPNRARGYSCGSGQDSGARGLAAAAPAPPSPPPFSSNSSSSSSPWARPQAFLPALPQPPPLSQLRGHPLKRQPLSFLRSARAGYQGPCGSLRAGC